MIWVARYLCSVPLELTALADSEYGTRLANIRFTLVRLLPSILTIRGRPETGKSGEGQGNLPNLHGEPAPTRGCVVERTKDPVSSVRRVASCRKSNIRLSRDSRKPRPSQSPSRPKGGL